MARQYRPKYYPQLKQGTGFTGIHPTTGEQQECKGVEWYLDFLDTRGKRCRRKVHEGYCTCPTRKKGVCPHERLAMEAMAEFLSAPSPPEVVLRNASRDLSLDKFAAEYLLDLNDSRRHADRSKRNIVLSIETFLTFCRKNSIVDLDQVQRLQLVIFYRIGLHLGELVNPAHHQIRNGIIHIHPRRSPVSTLEM